MKKIDFSKLEHDPVEETELYQIVNAAANRKAQERICEFVHRWTELGLEQRMSHWMATMYQYDRFCFEKKRILMEDYGVDWKTPFELNPELYVLLDE